jgi:hypothetical protein
MYLLYTKKSTNPYSFTIINIISSSLWISYSQMKLDTPLIGSTDLVLFTISTIYIIHNIVNKIEPRGPEVQPK